MAREYRVIHQGTVITNRGTTRKDARYVAENFAYNGKTVTVEVRDHYRVQNYHHNGGNVQLERETKSFREAMKWASETPRSYVAAYDQHGWLIGDAHYSPANVPLNSRQLAARAREKSGHGHPNRSHYVEQQQYALDRFNAWFHVYRDRAHAYKTWITKGIDGLPDAPKEHLRPLARIR